MLNLVPANKSVLKVSQRESEDLNLRINFEQVYLALYVDIMYEIVKHAGHVYMYVLINFRIVRSRDPAVLKGCDIVVDVGGEYNPDTHRYDHHQR